MVWGLGFGVHDYLLGPSEDAGHRRQRGGITGVLAREGVRVIQASAVFAV